MKSATPVAANDPVIANASQPACNCRAASEIDLAGSRYASGGVSPTAQEAADVMIRQHNLALTTTRKGNLPQVSLAVV